MMENLRWIILLAGVVLLAAIYLYARWQGRRRSAHTTGEFDRAPRAGEHEIDPLFDTVVNDADVESELHRLDRLITDDARPAAAEDPAPPAPSAARSGEPEKIVTLFVLAPAGVPFRGRMLVEAMEAAGLEHGDMQIFHRTAGRGGRGEVLFSVADIYEPGTFDPGRLDNFTTQGVVLFMQLPGPVEAVAAFDAMVEAARTLATSLEGSLCDATRSVLTRQTIAHMREEVADFQLRQRVTRTAS